MKIIEYMKNIFTKVNQLPNDFVRDAEYDVILLYDVFGGMPLIRRTQNGRRYMLFEKLDDNQKDIVRKMGLNPKQHKTYDFNNRTIYGYRAPINLKLSNATIEMIAKIEASYYGATYCFPVHAKRIKQEPRYKKYVQAYIQKTK